MQKPSFPIKLGGEYSIFDQWLYKFWYYVTTLALGDLADVNLTGLAAGDILYYDGAEWIVVNYEETVLDFVGGALVDTATVEFTYDDVNDQISAEVPNNAITFAKFQQIATSRLLGRYSSGTGNVEALVIGTGLTLSTDGTLEAGGGGVGPDVYAFAARHG